MLKMLMKHLCQLLHFVCYLLQLFMENKIGTGERGPIFDKLLE